MADRDKLLNNALRKLGDLPLDFGFDSDMEKALGGDLDDALREMRTSVDSVNDDAELYVEIRTVWWALRRLRNSASVNFKYSTGSDGRSVDKSMIPKMIGEIMGEYDQQFRDWKSTIKSSTGSIWNRSES